MERRAFLKIFGVATGATIVAGSAVGEILSRERPLKTPEEELSKKIDNLVIEGDYLEIGIGNKHGFDYARAKVPRDLSNWDIDENEVTNNKAIIFPKCTGHTGYVTHVFVYDSRGNLLIQQPLTRGLSITEGIIPEFGEGDLTITLE